MSEKRIQYRIERKFKIGGWGAIDFYAKLHEARPRIDWFRKQKPVGEYRLVRETRTRTVVKEEK